MNMTERSNRSEIKEKTTNEYFTMLPDAMDALRSIIKDPEVNPAARVQAISLVMDRTLGKPEETVRIENDREKMEATQRRLEELFLAAREERKKKA